MNVRVGRLIVKKRGCFRSDLGNLCMLGYWYFLARIYIGTGFVMPGSKQFQTIMDSTKTFIHRLELLDMVIGLDLL
jgi:uncharacterized membrane protein YphA (DoxX/SURF4 family)